MANAPRYLGTTAAEALAYFRNAGGTDLLRQYFDLDGDGLIPADSEEERVFVRAVCSAETEVDEAFGAAFGAPFTGTVPDSVLEIVAMRVPWCATRFRVMADPERASARVLYKDADARIARLRADNGGRLLQGSATVAARPPAGVLADAPEAAPLLFDPGGGFGGFG